MNTKPLLFASLPLLLLASCSLPPSKAWRIVKTEGLLPYVAMELGRKPFPAGMGPVEKSCCPSKPMPTLADSAPTSLLAVHRAVGIGNPYLQLTTVQPTPQSPRVVEPRVAVPPRPSTPVVASSGLHRPAVPASVGASSAAPVRVIPSVSSMPIAPASKPPVEKPDLTASVPKQEPMTKPKPENSVPPPLAGQPQPKATESKPSQEKEPLSKQVVPPAGNMAATAQKSVVTAPVTAPNEVPYGMAIPGRLGFVHSPFTGKLQIVDVTGLQANQEVKCPFSGKLFRIPAAALSPAPAAVPEDKVP